ncbi:MAG: NAD(P)/FAD-dependent oxidoreductase [Granulosicoccaceae bacterium]
MSVDILYANDRRGEYPDSYYAASCELLPTRPELAESIECDVCVVGGGYMGLSSALHLAEAGYDVVLLDAHRVGWGASGRNGGQVGSGQRVEQDALEAQLGQEAAQQLWQIGEDSKALVRSLIEHHCIDAEYKPGIIHAELKASAVAESHEYAEHLHKHYGYDQVEPLDRRQICEHLGTEAYHGGSLDKGAGHVHPLKFALGLAQSAMQAGVRVFEKTQVLQLDEGEPALVHTASGQVRAKFVVLGCNGYLGKLQSRVAARVMPINNYIVATEPLGKEQARSLIRDDVAVGDSKFVINYYRLSDDHRLLFGGGESYSYNFPRDIAGLVRKHMLTVYPQLQNTKIDYAWGGTLGVTVNRLPHVERLSPNILSASGFSGHGVAMATLAGQLCSEVISTTAERFDVMASVPTWPFPGGAALRSPLLKLAMTWYSLRDRL